MTISWLLGPFLILELPGIMYFISRCLMPLTIRLIDYQQWHPPEDSVSLRQSATTIIPANYQTPTTNTKQYGIFLSDQGAGSSALVSPGRREDTDGLVVAGQTVDTGLDQNETELAVHVLAVALEVLADGDGLRILAMNHCLRPGINTFLIKK